MALGSRTVAQRDVQFNVNLGVFRAELGEAGRIYAQSTGQMSTESLRLSVAEEKVARAIKLHGAESLQARNATVALRREMELTSVSSRSQEAAFLSDERAMGRFSRGALAAAGASSELKRALLLGSGSFLIGVGIAGLLRASLDAAKNEQAALSQLQVALKNTGQSWNVYGAHVDGALQAQVRATGFTKEELTQALTQNVRRFGNLNDALKANLLAADVARQKNIGLADAQTLVQRASLGQSRSLLTLGINFTKVTSNVDALRASTSKASKEQLANAKAADAQANRTAALQAIFDKFHGSAAKFLTTSAGKQALFNAELKDSEEIIGGALLPTVNHYLDRLSSWLDKMNRTGRLQKDVNTFMHAASGAGHAAEAAFHGIEDVAIPLSHALGGTEKTVRLLIGALIAFKLRGAAAFAAGAREIETSAAATAASINSVAAAEGRAAAGSLFGGLSIVGRPGVAVGNVAQYTGGSGAATPGIGIGKIASFILGAFVIGNEGESGSVKKVSGTIYGRKVTATVAAMPDGDALVYYTDPEDGSKRILTLKKGTNLGKALAADLLSRHPGINIPELGNGDDRSNHPGIQGPATPNNSGSRGGKPGPPIIGLTEKQQTPLLIAQGTKSTADDITALRGQLAILQGLLKQKNLTPADLNALLQQRNSVQDQIDSILATDAGTRTSKAKKAAEAAKKAAEARKKAEQERAKSYLALLKHDESGLKDAVTKAKLTPSEADDIKALQSLQAFYAKEANDPRLTRALRDAFRSKSLAESVAIKKAEQGAKQTGNANINEFLQAFTSLFGLSSNVGAGINTRIPTVVVNQHFPHPPTKDGYREAIAAYHANRAAFD